MFSFHSGFADLECEFVPGVRPECRTLVMGARLRGPKPPSPNHFWRGSNCLKARLFELKRIWKTNLWSAGAHFDLGGHLDEKVSF